MVESKQKRNIFFGLLILATGFGVYFLLKKFFSVIILSAMFAVLVHPMYKWLQSRLNRTPHLASLLTITISFVLIIIPLTFFINLFIQEAIVFNQSVNFFQRAEMANISEITLQANRVLASIPFINYQITPLEVKEFITSTASPISSYLLNKALALGSSSLGIITNFFIFLVLIYFLIPELPKMKEFFKKISPLDDKIDELYMNRAVGMFIATIKGTLFVAVAEGIITGIIFWLAGVEYILTLTLLVMMLSIIPIIGPTLVTVPVGLWFLLSGNFVGALIVLGGQFIVTSNADNVIRAVYTSKQTSLHPAIMLLSIIGGLHTFGVLGFIYGPLIMILFVTTLEIYMKHYKY